MIAQQRILNSEILYVEDDTITREQLTAFLKPKCKTLYIAKDGDEGLQLYKRFNPDIVITDIEMPKLSGLELARSIRKVSLSTQIIIITAYKKPQYLLEAVNLQLIQYLVKPISLEKITDVLMFTSNYLDGVEVDTRMYLEENIFYDTYTKELVKNDEIISLSKYERNLIEILIEKTPAPLSYESINANIYSYGSSKNAIKLLVSALRNKIGRQSIVNVSGFGYKLNLISEKQC